MQQQSVEISLCKLLLKCVMGMVSLNKRQQILENVLISQRIKQDLKFFESTIIKEQRLKLEKVVAKKFSKLAASTYADRGFGALVKVVCMIQFESRLTDATHLQRRMVEPFLFFDTNNKIK